MTDYLLNDEKPIKDHYVYGWVNADWGGVYFYVGKGTKDRYKKISHRGRAFTTMQEEDKIKTEMLFNLGYPIVDGEGHSAWIKNKAIALAKKEKRENDPNFKEGRPKKFSSEQIELALDLMKTHAANQVVEMTGISRSTLCRAKRKALAKELQNS